jgi:mono/diheme cytochrome c family protein
MKRSSSIKPWLRKCGALGAISAALCALLPLGAGGDPATNAPASKPAATTATNAPAVKPAAKKLTGADLYAINCNRCHPERYPTEFNAAQWKTLMLHMRVRANLPAAQAKKILKYLEEESGN